MKRVLITGAAGKVGSALRERLRGVYPALRLSDIAPLGEAGPGEELHTGDVSDMAAMETAMQGVDGAVLLGAIPTEDSWDNILQSNFVGTYNGFEAARRAGVKRIVFASSNHAIGFYRRERTIDTSVVPRPDSRYGLSKAFGESLGSLYADKHGIGVMCMRIGSFQPRPMDTRQLSTWISPDDTARLVRCGLEAPDLHFSIVYGVSANTRSWWDNAAATALGYAPRDNAEDYAEEILARAVPEDADAIAKQFQGGVFTAAEFSGDADSV